MGNHKMLFSSSGCVSCLGRCGHCYDNNKNNSKGSTNNSNNNNNTMMTIRLIFAIWSLLTLIGLSAVQGAAVYSNVDFQSNPSFEPICSAQQELFVESDGKESSLILEFNDGIIADHRKSCTRILSAPPNYGFIVRLILPKIRRGSYYNMSPSSPSTSSSSSSSSASAEVVARKAKSKMSASTLNEMTSLIQKLNSTALKTALGRTCPLSIFSSLDPHTPQWRVDPCQLEDTAPEMEDPVRLFHGRIRIVWEHGSNALKSKLMVTVLGKGSQCHGENKHPCLKIGDEPILCISKDLVCDGIRHCPYSNEYDSDEDYAMCWRRRRFGEPIPPAMESDIFEHFALEIFRNLFAFDAPSMPDAATTTSSPNAESKGTAPETANQTALMNSTTLRKVDAKQVGGEGNQTSSNAANTTESSSTESAGGHHRRNSTRTGFNSDLSKYGPWGYLMLGMLLCGGALLICGLWASASQHAAQNEREAAIQNAGSSEHQTSNGGPPNYDELDPPPAYSVLFPNQKAASSATLSSLATVTATVAPPVVPPPSSATDTATASSSQQIQATLP